MLKTAAFTSATADNVAEVNNKLAVLTFCSALSRCLMDDLQSAYAIL